MRLHLYKFKAGAYDCTEGALWGRGKRWRERDRLPRWLKTRGWLGHGLSALKHLRVSRGFQIHRLEETCHVLIPYVWDVRTRFGGFVFWGIFCLLIFWFVWGFCLYVWLSFALVFCLLFVSRCFVFMFVSIRPPCMSVHPMCA